MNESKMNLDHERKIASLQERVNRLEDLCYSAKEVLNLEEASVFLGIAKSTLYKMTLPTNYRTSNPQASSSSLRRKLCLIGYEKPRRCRKRN